LNGDYYISFIISKLNNTHENNIELENIIKEKYPNLKFDFVLIEENRIDYFNEPKIIKNIIEKLFMLTNINNSFLYYSDNNIGYYEYIIDLLKKCLSNNKNIELNINFTDDINHNFNNNNKTILIDINYEHTLVKPGGRGSNNSPIGKIKIDNNSNDNENNFYLVRIDRYEYLIQFDIIIDYSNTNLYNVKESNLFNDFSNKYIYISSAIYDLYFNKENRNINCLTTFINTNEPRRLKLLEDIKEKKISHINVNNYFEKENLQHLYKNVKILINVHQTDHHDTIEELRILPALQCGVIVISENSPLTELIPYNEFIIWSSYDNILDKVKEVSDNYDYYHDLIFKNDKIENKLNELHEMNYNNLNNLLNIIK
jgi:hypothetical protein